MVIATRPYEVGQENASRLEAPMAFRDRLLRGGRMTKWKGQVASCAPTLGACLPANVSAVALGAALLTGPAMIGAPGTTAIAQDACMSVSAGGTTTVTCSEGGAPATGEQTVNTAVAGPTPGDQLVVTINPGFDISTPVTVIVTDPNRGAFELASDNGIVVTQNAGSSVVGGDYGIRTNNRGAGDTVLTIDGDVTGQAWSAIDAKAGRADGIDAGSMTITTSGNITGLAPFATPLGAASGIYATNGGTGSLTITATDGTISGGWWGIQSQNWNGGDLTVNTSGAIVDSPIGRGVYARNWSGSGDDSGNQKAGYADPGSVTVTTGDVRAAGRGIFVANGGTGDLTIDSIAGTVTSGAEGIEAQGYSNSGAVRVTTADVTAVDVGIDATTTGSEGIEITTTGGTVQADETGIRAQNNGTGATTLTLGRVVADADGDGNGAAVRASNGVGVPTTGVVTIPGGTDIRITTNGEILGSGGGIIARNFGTGVTEVTTNDVVNAGVSPDSSVGNPTSGQLTGVGIYTRNVAGSGAMTITANDDVLGGWDGINARHRGTGDLFITANGNVDADSDDNGNTVDNNNRAIGVGIFATVEDASEGTSITTNKTVLAPGGALTIRATGADNVIDGWTGGIYGRSSGRGDVTITAEGTVSTENNQGIFGWVDVAGQGSLTITSTGTVTTNDTGSSGNGDAGIRGRNRSDTGTALTITANNVVALGEGIEAFNRYGRIGITTTGAITTQNDLAEGIIASAQRATNAEDIDIEMASGSIQTVGTGSHGILSIHGGTGAAITEVGATATIATPGDGSDGVFAIAGTAIDVDVAGSILGGRTGPATRLFADGGTGIHAASGAFDVNGLFVANANDVLIDIAQPGTVGALSDHAILVEGGSAIIANDGTVTGYVTTFDNDDRFTNNSPNSFNVRDFADDLGADGIRDTENVALNDFGGGFDVFDNTANGAVRLLTVQDASGFSAGTDDDAAPTQWLTSGVAEYTPMAVQNTGGVQARSITEFGVEQGHFVNLERFENAGAIIMQDALTGGTGPVWGDVMVITGSDTAGTNGDGVFVSNGGALLMDTVLNDGAIDQTDVLVVDRTETDTGGATQLFVANAGGTGSLTDANGNGQTDEGEGILVVEVLDGANSADDAFALGAPAVVGAFAYDLFQGDVGGDWYLVSNRFSEATPVYESLPSALGALNTLPTLQQRVGNRYWQEPQAPAPMEMVFCKDASRNFLCPVTASQSDVFASSAQEADVTIEQSAIWARIEGAHAHVDPDVSTTGAQYDVNHWQLRSGIDGLLAQTDTGKLIGGVNAFYGQSRLDVHSAFGDGAIDTTGYGLAATLTWYGENGFYLDGQAQYQWFDSDLGSDVLGALADNVDGTGYALSAEIGQRLGLSETLTLIPQAQLTYASVDFDSFVDPFGASVSLSDGDSLRGRLGLALEHQDRWLADDGTVSRSSVYGIANLTYEFLDGTTVDVSGTAFDMRPDRWTGEMGLGGTVNWNDDRYSIHGEVSAATSLANFAQSHQLKGNLGFRVKW